MYIEDELWNWIKERCAKVNFGIEREGIEDIINNCGIWYSFEGIKYETEDFDMTLEECYNNYWFIITDNKTKFVNPDEFANDLDDYLGIDMSMYDD